MILKRYQSEALALTATKASETLDYRPVYVAGGGVQLFNNQQDKYYVDFAWAIVGRLRIAPNATSWL